MSATTPSSPMACASTDAAAAPDAQSRSDITGFWAGRRDGWLIP